jgi:hypothetical protein
MSPARMRLAEAVKRAGSLADLMPAVRDGRIMTHHNGLYSWPECDPIKCKDQALPATWWEDAHDVDPAAGRAQFTREAPWGPYRLLAIGIELERAAIEALWPA